MKVILIENIKNLGRKGDLKDVSDGYARNFLLANGLAKIATTALVESFKKQQQENKQKEIEKEKLIQLQASKMSGKNIVITAKAKEGKLFGSITAKDIASELKKDGFEISEKNIKFSPMKHVGKEKAEVVFELGIIAKISIEIKAK